MYIVIFLLEVLLSVLKVLFFFFLNEYMTKIICVLSRTLKM